MKRSKAGELILHDGRQLSSVDATEVYLIRRGRDLKEVLKTS